jgi:hypothetical protein
MTADEVAIAQATGKAPDDEPTPEPEPPTEIEPPTEPEPEDVAPVAVGAEGDGEETEEG